MALFRSKKKTQQERLVEASSLNSADDIAFAEKLLSRPTLSEESSYPSSLSAAGKAEAASQGVQYSHGLEDIYAIETIDVSTVRPMGSGDSSPAVTVADDVDLVEALEIETPPEAMAVTAEPVQESAVEGALVQREESVPLPDPTPQSPEEPPGELEFDLGEAFRGWMPSMVLDEPVAVLSLSKQATRALVDAGMQTLRDLVRVRKEGATSIAGIGQGHFDEMAQRLDAYLKGRDHEQCRRVDFSCLVRSLLSDVPAPDAYLATEQYGLAHLFPLTAAQEMELRRVSEEQREVRRKVVLDKLADERRRSLLTEKLRQITNAFLKPWIRGRSGLATDLEVMERVEAISTDVAAARNALRWISDLFDVVDPVGQHLIRITDGVVAADSVTLEQFQALEKLVATYFYAPSVGYRLEELVTRIDREMAVSWEQLDRRFIEKALDASRAFTVCKRESGYREVTATISRAGCRP